MKKMLIFVWLTSITYSTLPAYGQVFMNLDFEAAQVIPLNNSFYHPIATTNALPGWTVLYITQQQSQIPYNRLLNGEVTLWATNAAVIDGNFSVGLGNNVSISQTGLVPLGVETLFFDMDAFFTNGIGGTLSVFLGGQPLSYFAISNAPNYTVYGADISTLSGQTAALTFFTSNAKGVPGLWTIDDIQFSDQSIIPEPGELVLMALGAILLSFHCWWHRSQKGFNASYCRFIRLVGGRSLRPRSW